MKSHIADPDRAAKKSEDVTGRSPRDPALRDARDVETILTSAPGSERESAYAALMERHWTVLSMLLSSQLRDPREAEDVAQDAFIRAFRRLHRLNEPRAFLGWLIRIARNLATDRIRSRRRTVSLDALRGGREEPPPNLRQPASHEVELQTKEEIARVLNAVGTLPEKYRVVVTLRYVKGLDGKTMSTMLGEPEGTVRNRLFRALEKLRQQLQ